MNTRIVAGLVVLVLMLAVACGSSAVAEDTGVADQEQVDVEALVRQVLVLEDQVQKLQDRLDGLGSEVPWASVDECVSETIPFNPQVRRPPPVSVFLLTNIRAACARIIETVSLMPIRVQVVIQEAWNGRIENHNMRLNCLEYGC